jgi:hypothetical protein
MGIDVRAYAQANQSFTPPASAAASASTSVRAGPRLENKPIRWKAGQPIRVYAVDL